MGALRRILSQADIDVDEWEGWAKCETVVSLPLNRASAFAKLDSRVLLGRYGAALISDARKKIEGRKRD